MSIVTKQIKGNWQYGDGTPASGANLVLTLSQSAVLNDGSGSLAPQEVTIVLDSTGSIPSTVNIYYNDDLLPTGTFWTWVILTDADGQIFGPVSGQIIGTAPANLNAIIPISNVVAPTPAAPTFGPITVVQPAGTNLHVVVDSGGGGGGGGDVTITSPVDGSGNVKVAIESGISNPLPVSLPSATVTALTPPAASAIASALSGVAVTNAGTFAVQAASTLAAETTKVIGTVRVEGNLGVALDAVLGATKPANTLQVGGNDGTNAYAIPLVSGGGAVVDNTSQWGGTAVAAAATTSPVGTEAAPIVRELAAKTPRSISTTVPTTSQTVYYGPLAGNTTSALAGWYDTAQTGATWVQCQVYADHGQSAGSNGYYLIMTSDPANTSETPVTVSYVLQANGQTSAFAGAVTKRYWQIEVINGSIAIGVFELTSSEWQGGPSVALNPATGAQNLDGVVVTDAMAPSIGPLQPYLNYSGILRSAPGAVVDMVAISGASSGPFYYQRTPNIWRGAEFSAAGANTLWQPPSNKKVRLMRYMFEVSEDATITSGPLPIRLGFAESLGTATAATLAYPGFGFTHRTVVPGTVLATSGSLYSTNWIDLGLGQLLTTAGRPLQAGILTPQSTSAINPTWTIASNVWEAGTIGFKTNGSTGDFKLVQQTNGASAATSIAIGNALLNNTAGNALYVVFRCTASGGTPTVTVTDTAGNSWTTATLQGSGNDYVGIAYATNIIGLATNTITITTTTHTSSQIAAIVLEYAGTGRGGGLDAALVTATGTSTSPASGNYTPSTAGDLILTFFGTSASLASQPTVGSNFVIRGAIFNATQGCVAVADNFGNGALATGVVNAIVVGTEE